MYCTFRSLLRAPPLPASHEKKLLAKWFINSKEPIALVARGIVLSLTSILLDLIMKQFNLSSVWLLFEIILSTVFALYVFSASSLCGEYIVITGLHWTVKKTIPVIFF